MISNKKERSEFSCLLPSTNNLMGKQMEPILFGRQDNFITSKFYKTSVKKPTINIIKAATHYKVGKHRLSVKEIGYTHEIPVPVCMSKLGGSVSDLVKNAGNLVDCLPTTMGPIVQTKLTKVRVNTIINIAAVSSTQLYPL